MKISSKLWMSVACTLGAAVVLGVVVLVTYRDLRRAHWNQQRCHRIVQSVFELNLLTEDYLDRPTERSLQQWRGRYESLRLLLEGMSFRAHERQAALRRMRANYRDAGQLFSQVLETTKKAQEGGNAPLSRELKTRLGAQLRASFHSMIGEVFALSRRVDVGLRRVVYEGGIMVAGAMLLLTVVLVTTYLFVKRSVVGPVARLHEGTEVIAEGNLDHQVEVSGSDEVSQLARSFNRMAQSLQRITASRDELAEEVARRERAEKDLKRTLSELERSNKELEQFAYVASHDLQEPLRKIRAFSDRIMAKCEGQLGERGNVYLERMNDAAVRMSQLINDLLALSRVSTKAEPFVSVDLNEVAEGVVSDLETRIQQTEGEVKVGDLPTIEADRTQARQLLQNLIGNGLKFAREDVPPVVEVEGHLEEQDGREVCELKISDNGIGIEEKHREKIFGVFQRLHARGQYEGTGVGLAVCARIVDRHGGDIKVESEPGEGTTFVIRLPARQEHQEGQ
jgi:signal transduction histidine kinase